MAERKYTVIFEPAEEGGYVVYVPALPGCVTQGETLEEAKAMALEAIQGHLETMKDLGLPIPEEDKPLPDRLVVEQLAVAI
ncbi:type II toxin-antitoxin system HicB family antitoxin [bacterium]|nr:type II toxin-antitoxin system HicB family antitoxin [FCB group bacterium]MBL7191809.1 type II toxin-antitoxin system HicB family antitoxin [bacterium]